MSGIIAQAGVAAESTYGTPVAATRFYEFLKDGVAGNYDRIDSAGIRAGTRVVRADRFAVNPKGAAGDLSLEVLTKNFGFWLDKCLGTVSTGTVTDTMYTHTAKIGSLTGKAFTLQMGRPDINDSIVPFTYEGGKVTSWELSNQVDQTVQFTASCDFAAETVGTGAGAYALQTPSYPTGMELLTFVGGTVTIGGVAVGVTDVSLKCDNGLKDDRYFLRGSGRKKEPLEDKMRKITASFSVEWDNSTGLYQRVTSATAAGALAAVVLKWVGPTLGGSTTYPSLTVTLPAFRFEGETPNVDGPSLISHKLSGSAFDDGTSSSPIQIDYCTKDSTP